jgi:hypothetical protein
VDAGDGFGAATETESCATARSGESAPIATARKANIIARIARDNESSNFIELNLLSDFDLYSCKFAINCNPKARQEKDEHYDNDEIHDCFLQQKNSVLSSFS